MMFKTLLSRVAVSFALCRTSWQTCSLRKSAQPRQPALQSLLVPTELVDQETVSIPSLRPKDNVNSEPTTQ